MPGCDQIGLDSLGPEIEEIASLGVPAVILFGLPEEKDAVASGATVRVSAGGRVFFTFHPEAKPSTKLAEWKDGKR